MWNIEKIVSKGKYNYAVVKGHPFATDKWYVLEHRIVMENFLGRLLDDSEVVHHLNGDGKDNRIENLSVMDRHEHARMHSFSNGRMFVDLICPECGKIFTREKRQTHISKKGILVNGDINTFLCTISIFVRPQDETYPTVETHMIRIPMTQRYFAEYYRVEQNAITENQLKVLGPNDLEPFHNGIRRTVNADIDPSIGTVADAFPSPVVIASSANAVAVVARISSIAIVNISIVFLKFLFI